MTHEEILTTLGHYVDYLIAGSTAEAPLWNIEKVRSGKPNKWNYIDGCMITACLSLYKTTGDEKFLDFSKKFLDYFVKDNGVIETYDPAEYNLDNVNQGKNLFTLYDLTGNQRYRDAIETIRGQLESQPRTKEGNFWHKKIYPNQVWLDGTYMAQPFYMEYETRCNGMHGCIDSYKQFMNIQKHMKDAKTGIVFRYASRMVSLLYLLSRPSARKISRTLRMLSCSLSPVRFLMSCCSSVDAPRFVPQMRLPVKAFSAAPMVPLRLMPGSVRKFLSSMAMTAFCRFSGMAESSRQIRFSLRESEAYSLPLMS